jgi:hypothetical protein
MTISTRDDLINALANNSSRFIIDKASIGTFTVGQLVSLWTVSGTPSAGSAPGTTPIVPTNATIGAIGFSNQTPPATSYLAWAWASFSLSTSAFEIHDRIACVSGASGTITTAQTTGCAIDLTTTTPSSDRLGSADYSDVSWFIEVYTTMGATGVNATVNVTYGDGTTGNLAAIALGATPRQGRLYPLVSASAGKYIRGVNSVTLSATTGTAGNFGVTATRQRATVLGPVSNFPNVADWAQLGLPQIPNDSCLSLIVQAPSTSTPAIRGQGKIAHG